MTLRIAIACALLGLPLASRAADLALAANERRALAQPGATAAFAVDPGIVDASIHAGRLVLVARGAGETTVSVVSGDQVRVLSVSVQAPVPRLPLSALPRSRNTANLAVGYDTALRRTTLEGGVQLASGTRQARLQAEVIRNAGEGSAPARVAVPSARLEWQDGERRIALLDEYVESSPLLLDGVVLRGVHADDGRARLHAGVASTQPWEDGLVPRHGDRAVSLSRDLARGAITWRPSLLWLPDAQTRVPGAVVLGAARGTAADAWQWRADVGWSDRPAGSFDVAWRSPAQQGWLRGAWRPAQFAALDAARPAGGFLDGAWTAALSDDVQANASLSTTRVESGSRQPRAATGQADVRLQLGEHASVNAGLGASTYRDVAVDVSRATATVGAGYDTRAWGASAQYRYQQASGFARAGHGARLGLRVQQAGLRAVAHVDAQQNAPGLALTIAPGSDLGRALAELGVLAGSPEDMLRLFAEHGSVFARHGVTLGDLTRDAWRVQAGLDVSWESARHHRLGVRVNADASRGLADRRRNVWATLFGTWRFPDRWELEANLSRWSFESEGAPTQTQTGLQVLLRKFFDEVPVPFAGRGAISGRLVPQDAGGGRVPVGGIEVVLDGQRRTRTDADGRFVFDAAGPGEHDLVATLAPGQAAYFTSASRQRVRAGERVEIGVMALPAQVHGRVTTDAGLPLAGVTVVLQGPREATAVTDATGAYRFATLPGAATLTLQAESLPPGYDAGSIAAQTLQADVRQPTTAHFSVRAQRSVRGRVAGMVAGVRVDIPATGQSVTPDASGAFILRGLPAGEITVRVTRGARSREERLVLPQAPGRTDDVVLPAP